MIPSSKYKVTLTLVEPILGAVPKDESIYDTWVRSKAPEDADTLDELDTVPDTTLEEKGWTGFHTAEDGSILIYNYVIRGYIESACKALRRIDGTLSSKIRAYRQIIKGLVFIWPRRIPLALPAGASLGTLERPLRAETPQGPRVALARSDTAPEGTKLSFAVEVLGEIKVNGEDATEALLHEWFAYGRYSGLGQWRTGGYGRFEYELERAE